MSISVAFFLDTRRGKRKSKVYPVKLRVTSNRVSRNFTTIYDLTEEDYKKLKARNVSETLRKIRDDLDSIQSDAKIVIKQIDPFEFGEFKRDFIDGHQLFKQRTSKRPARTESTPSKFDFSEYYKKFPIIKEAFEPGTIGSVYCSYIKQLISENRIGNALKYRDSFSSVKKFGGNAPFREISVSWLRRYEAWMLNQGRSRTTVGILLRGLRTIFNEADRQKIINKQKCYPFGRGKYIIPTSKKANKSLEQEDLNIIYYDQPSCENEEYAKALWFFCYFGNGMNPKDLAYLKFKDIHGEYLTFYRAKTEFTTRNDPKPITVYINEDMYGIINRWGNKDRNRDNYIFPILETGLTALQEYVAVTRVTHFINDWMKKIGERLKINIKPTTIVTRHSWATRLKNSGVSTEFIQEGLGHMNIRTTENYLGSFPDEVKKEVAGKLVSFKRIDGAKNEKTPQPISN
jgi:integrase